MKPTKDSIDLRLRHMQLQKQKIERWKKKTAAAEAKKLKTKPDKVRIVPWNTKQRLTAADKLVAEKVCPVNQRLYYVIWSLK